MDLNEYMLEIVVKDRLAEATGGGPARVHRARAARPVSPSVRVRWVAR